MTQAQAVIETIEALGGIATLNQINQNIFKIKDCVWRTKTPFASIRHIVQLVERELLATSLDAEDNEALYPSWKGYQSETMAFFNQAIRLSDKQREKASDKNFWNLISSYLHFLDQDFDRASSYLANVKSNDELYMKTVDSLTSSPNHVAHIIRKTTSST